MLGTLLLVMRLKVWLPLWNAGIKQLAVKGLRKIYSCFESSLHPVPLCSIPTIIPSAASLRADALFMTPNRLFASPPKALKVAREEAFHTPVLRRLLCIIVAMRRIRARTIKSTGNISQSHRTRR